MIWHESFEASKHPSETIDPATTLSFTCFMRNPENYPTEKCRNHYSSMAKNAAIVSHSTHGGTAPQKTTEKMGLSTTMH
jgi:hypothetical protein